MFVLGLYKKTDKNYEDSTSFSILTQKLTFFDWKIGFIWIEKKNVKNQVKICGIIPRKMYREQNKHWLNMIGQLSHPAHQFKNYSFLKSAIKVVQWSYDISFIGVPQSIFIDCLFDPFFVSSYGRCLIQFTAIRYC